ncbi:hypothetical protein, partial [Escherichia coli]|uniref:hypothetical protein n=1 Tax=Escherichia coli TaxID=562 RepID=UPI001A7E7E2E
MLREENRGRLTLWSYFSGIKKVTQRHYCGYTQLAERKKKYRQSLFSHDTDTYLVSTWHTADQT